MNSYYIDPERCYEVPLRIPLPDRKVMASRLANIGSIMKEARERQSKFCVEHRKTLSNRPSRYRQKAAVIMGTDGKPARFAGNLTERFFDYLEFHNESIPNLSALAIQVPPVCSPLSPPRPCLFAPPKQGNFDQIVNGNLSWSQYAAPAPAGWRSQFLYARQWEMIIDRRAANDYSDKEREAEWVALESQRRDLALRLCSEVEAPPPLQRKTTIPLPLTTPRPRASEIMSRCKTSRAYRDLPAVDDPSPTNGLRKQHSISQAQVRNARPSLSVTIPGSQHQPQLLSGPLYTSPLSMSGLNVTLPSVLLDSKVIRTHLDNVHGPHRFPIPPESPQLAYPSSSLPRRLVLNPQMGASVVPEPTGVPQLPAGVLSLNFDIFTTHVSVQSGVVIRQPRPVYSFGALKRRASQDDFSVHATKKIRTY